MDHVGEQLRVLYFTRGLSPHDRRFLQALSQTSHLVHFLPLFPDVSWGAAAEIPQGITKHTPLCNGNTLAWHRYPELVRNFRDRAEKIGPDLVHAGPIHLSATISSMAGFHPLVSMSWGSDLLYETRKPWVELAARFTLRRSDAFIGDCRAVEEKAIKFGMDADRIVLFPWGTDLDHFSLGQSDDLRRKLGWEDSFILISTRSFEPLYGVDVIIDAFIQVAEVEPGLRLLLLGEGSQRQIFEMSLADAGLAERAYFAGRVSRERLPEYYRTADVYLSASYSDGSSVSLLEAMACGLPALVSDIPGNREWVEPGVNGWWFRTGKVDSLVDGIQEALESDRRELMQRAARETIVPRADWNENFPKLLEAYQIAQEHAKPVW
jgi:glycosyltransferase involved in cell wall biosynthesis